MEVPLWSADGSIPESPEGGRAAPEGQLEVTQSDTANGDGFRMAKLDANELDDTIGVDTSSVARNGVPANSNVNEQLADGSTGVTKSSEVVEAVQPDTNRFNVVDPMAKTEMFNIYTAREQKDGGASAREPAKLADVIQSENEVNEDLEKQRRLEETKEILMREMGVGKPRSSHDEKRQQLLRAMQEEAEEQMQMLQSPLHDEFMAEAAMDAVRSVNDAERLTLDASSFAALQMAAQSSEPEKPHVSPLETDPFVVANGTASVRKRSSASEQISAVQPAALPQHVVPGEQRAHPNVQHEDVSSASYSGTQGMPEDPLAMSSASYFGPYTRRISGASVASSMPDPNRQVQRSEMPVFAPEATIVKELQPLQPDQDRSFPTSKAQYFERKMAQVSAEVLQVCELVARAVERNKIHPIELEQLMQLVKDIRFRVAPLADEDLESLGWPSAALQRMGEMDEGLTCWHQYEAYAKSVVAAGQTSLEEVVEVLSNLLVTWCRLGPLVEGRLCIDLDLQSRAQGTLPLVSMVLDKATVLAKESMDDAASQQLLVLLSRAIEQPGLESLGAAPLLTQALHELQAEQEEFQKRKVIEDAMQQSQRKVMMVAQQYGSQLLAPETLWRAVTNGDLEVVEAIVYQGGLVSGQTLDQQGHSVFWDAVAFQQPDMALLLWKHFTPGTPYGVNISETHQRNGNCLLHLVSGIKDFSLSSRELFSKVFKEMPESLRLHKNLRGQSFLHVAAGHVNVEVLKLAASAGLVGDFSDLDNAGWSPRRLLEYHLNSWRVAEAPPVSSPTSDQATSMPKWCQFPSSVSTSPFLDVDLEVNDFTDGSVRLPAHAVLLAAHSPEWHRQLSALGVGRFSDGASSSYADRKVLVIDPQSCSSALVLKHVLKFIYTGDTSCSFEGKAFELYQLYRLCLRYELPSRLTLLAQDSLLSCFNDPLGATVLPALLRDAKELRLPSPVRQFVSRHFITQDAAFYAASDEDRPALLVEALSELESCFSVAQRVQEDSLSMSMASIASGGQLGALSMASVPTMSMSMASVPSMSMSVPSVPAMRGY